MAWGDLAVESQTLSPLPANLKSGLTAITLLAFISFFASCALFFYLSFKILSWHFFLRDRRASEVQPTGSFQRAVDFTLGIDGIFTEENDNNNADGQAAQPNGAPVQHTPKHPNQFLILIVNLLLADMHQGVAFFLNVEWLRKNAVDVDSPTCFTQGLFVSLGDLSSSMFITAIAFHTYFAVVKRRRVRQKVLYLLIASIWVFVYAISFLPIAATRGGAEYGGFFVRAGSWVSLFHSIATLLTDIEIVLDEQEVRKPATFYSLPLDLHRPRGYITTIHPHLPLDSSSGSIQTL